MVRLSDSGYSKNVRLSSHGLITGQYVRLLDDKKICTKLDHFIIKNIFYDPCIFIKWSSLATIRWPDNMSGYQMVVRLSNSGLGLNRPFDNRTCPDIGRLLYYIVCQGCFFFGFFYTLHAVFVSLHFHRIFGRNYTFIHGGCMSAWQTY